MGANYAKEQPKDGEVILTCGHIKNRHKPFHFFKLETPMNFIRPDGSTGEDAAWFIQCRTCFAKAPGEQNTVAGDGVWKGNAPAIKKPVRN